MTTRDKEAIAYVLYNKLYIITRNASIVGEQSQHMYIVNYRHLIQKYHTGWIIRITRKQFVLHKKKYHIGRIFRTAWKFILHNKKYHIGRIFRTTVNVEIFDAIKFRALWTGPIIFNFRAH